MLHPVDRLPDIHAGVGRADTSRRTVLLAPLLASLPIAIGAIPARASIINPSETTLTLPDAIRFVPWSGAPPKSGDMARLYGDLNARGPYLVFTRWHPGYFSAPHSYRTDRISVVVSGTWWVNSGADFDPEHAVPVPAGGFVLRHAHTPHYDGVPRNGKEPAVIALFGTGPVGFQLVDPHKPPWRRV